MLASAQWLMHINVGYEKRVGDWLRVNFKSSDGRRETDGCSKFDFSARSLFLPVSSLPISLTPIRLALDTTLYVVEMSQVNRFVRVERN